MSDATLGNLYAAVFDAVEALGPTGSMSFACVKEFGGEVTQEQIEQTTLRKYPAALVALAGEDPEAASVETLTGEMDSIVRTQIVVYVAGLTLRGVKRSQENEASGKKGLFALVSEVIGAVNGLYLASLYGTRRVHYSGLRPQLLKPGALYVYALRFQSLRNAEQASVPNVSVPLEDIQGEVNIDDDGATLTNANPLARTRNQFP